MESSPKRAGRLRRLLTRELLAAFEIVRALARHRRVLILHVHPLGLFLALPFLWLWGQRASVCMHNDFISCVRSSKLEERVERCLWWIVARLGRITILAPNRHYRRYAARFFAPGTPIKVLAHPVADCAVYEKVAGEAAQRQLPVFKAGFFGRVETGRGIETFETLVKSEPESQFVVAGMWATRFPNYPNLSAFELPRTDLFCALLLRTQELFIDLRSDVYRIGESGVFWDAVGLKAPLLCGQLPRMYQQRVRQYMAGQSTSVDRPGPYTASSA